MRTLRLALTALLVIISVTGAFGAPIISEFMASNGGGLADEDGEFSDWIEIYNPEVFAVDLGGMHLTDDASELDQWEIPAVLIPPGGFLIVFASNKNRTDPARELHTNFRLNAGGGYLALIAADGVTTLSDFGPIYPEQFQTRSYGLGTFGGITQETLVTPGAAVTYLIPTDDSLGTSWTSVDFGDDTWAAGISGIGFESNGGPLDPSIATNISTEMKGVNAAGYFRFEFNYSALGK